MMLEDLGQIIMAQEIAWEVLPVEELGTTPVSQEGEVVMSALEVRWMFVPLRP